MKKLLALLGSVGLIATSGTMVVSCTKTSLSPRNINEVINETDLGFVGGENDKTIKINKLILDKINEKNAWANFSIEELNFGTKTIAGFNLIQLQINGAEGFTGVAKVFYNPVEANSKQLVKTIERGEITIIKTPNSTEEEKASLRENICDAQLLLEKENNTQKNINDMNNKLSDAINVFENAHPTEYSELETKIAQANQAIVDGGVNADKTTLTNAIQNAKAVLENIKATQEEVDKEVEVLSDAIVKFNKSDVPTDLTKLQIKFKEAEKIYNKYIDTKDPNIQKYMKQLSYVMAYARLEILSENKNPSQKETDLAVILLQNAIDLFDNILETPEVDYSKLKVKIGEALEIIEKFQETDRDDWRLEKLGCIAFDAQQLVLQKNSTQQEVDKMVVSLSDAMKIFE